MHIDRELACRAWLTYGRFPYDRLRMLMEDFDGSAEAVYDKTVAKGSSFLEDYLPHTHLQSLVEHSSQQAMHDMVLLMKKYEVGIMYLDDPCYPDQLLTIADPPVFLYWKGSTDCLSRRSLTMVGTRKASVTALEATGSMARQLSSRGITIISGMANGIDQAAHKGCLEGGSPTIAVLGCGIDQDYPSRSAALRQEILDRGGILLSEYPLGTATRGYHFPIRNRILSGLSRAVIMMECRIRSGSMSTVHHALDQGRDVFAWPGIPGSESAEGAHQLIREGATFFTSVDDILEDMGWQDLKAAPAAKEVQPDLSPDQRTVCMILRRGEQSFDQLAAQTGLDTPKLSIALTMLQLQGIIRALPGKSFKLI